jgi:hypothetical protein
MNPITPTILRRGASIMLFVGMVFVLYITLQHTEGATTFAATTGQGKPLLLTLGSKVTYNGVREPALTWLPKDLVPTADKFFNFSDVKPGDVGLHTIKVRIDNQTAWACLDFKNLTDDDNGQNEPESLVDQNGAQRGELSSNIEMFGWLDINGDQIYDIKIERPLFGTSTLRQAATTTLQNTSYPVGDSKNGAEIYPGKTKHVTIAWCAGDLVVNSQTGAFSCDATKMGNEAQTDSMKVDVSVRATAFQNNPNFLCNTGVAARAVTPLAPASTPLRTRIGL